MAASINLEILLTPPLLSGLQQRETRSLLHGVNEEIADVAFPLGAKAHHTFLIVYYLRRHQKALHTCCRASAWLAVAVIRA